MRYEIMMIDREKPYTHITTKLWNKYADRYGLDFNFYNLQADVSPNFNKWLWPQLVDSRTDYLLLVDSDTIPTPWCTEDILRFNSQAFNAARTGNSRNHARQIANATEFIRSRLEWDECINSGVMIISNSELTVAASEAILAFGKTKQLTQEQTYSQLYIQSQGMKIGYLPSKYNFVYAGEEDLWDTIEFSRICHIAHFPGYSPDVRTGKIEKLANKWA